MPDKVKLIIAVLILASGVVAYGYFEDIALLYKVLGMIGVVIVAAFIALQAEPGQAAWAFVKEARTEVRKVVWPSQRETLQTTGLVIAMVIIMALLLWGLDSLLLVAVQWFTGLGS